MKDQWKERVWENNRLFCKYVFMMYLHGRFLTSTYDSDIIKPVIEAGTCIGPDRIHISG